MFTDTHCHIFSEYYEKEMPDIVTKARNSGIKKIINNGTDTKSNREVLDICNKYPEVYAALGIHPEVKHYNEGDIQFIEQNIDRIVAIGEIGLDYHYDNFDKDTEKRLFIIQLELAQKYNKPVIVHSRDATKDTIDILKMYPKVKGVIHCFTGSLETAREYIKMGYKLGMNGVITFKNSKFREVLEKIPLESIVLETDSPYLSPEPLRGTRNEPANIIKIAEFISSIKNISIDELARITEQNVKDIFDI